MIIASFCFFLLGFVAIGVLSSMQRQKTSQDYLLASRSVKPWLAALSAVATNNSGYMFIGMIGYTYMFGLQSIWLMIGWIAGDFATSLFVHKNLREHTEKTGSLSFAGILSRWHNNNFKIYRTIAALITVAFMTTYAAAQLNAGSKALHVLFGWDYALGAVIGSAIVIAYCFAGGIRASIWTDAAQSFVMIIAMGLMFFTALTEIGGIRTFFEDLHNVSADYMVLFPENDLFGPWAGTLLFFLGWFFAGSAVIGQPHIMVRFMAMENASKMTETRLYYYGWFILFYSLTVLMALAARVLLPDTDGFDPELALPTIAGQLLPEILVGLVLAGLFAATMSTADSQILSTTASVTHDLVPEKKSSYTLNKIVTVAVTLCALAIALSGNQSVFTLVLISWSALGSAFAPLLIVYVMRQNVPEWIALAMMITGAGAMLLWRYFGFNDVFYEAGPGIVSGLLVFAAYKGVSSMKRNV